MHANREPAPGRNRTSVERTSETELLISRVFDAPAHRVFAAWTTPELMMRWWAPKSSGTALVSCEIDARVGGHYRVAFGNDGVESMVFFGRCLEMVPNARLAWTNEESADGAVTTVTFEETGGRTRLELREVYPTKEALDEAFIGMESCMPEQYDQLDDLLAEL